MNKYKLLAELIKNIGYLINNTTLPNKAEVCEKIICLYENLDISDNKLRDRLVTNINNENNVTKRSAMLNIVSEILKIA